MPIKEDAYRPYSHLLIEADDVEDENLLDYFPKACKFIDEALEGDGSVFIHCAMGKSRSATILAAYLMKAKNLTALEAINLIRKTRPMVDPNSGFWHQLDFWYKLKYTYDLDSSAEYGRWVWQREVESSNSVQRAPNRIRYGVENTPAVPEGGLNPQQAAGDTAWGVQLKCKKCRRTLATPPFIIPHKPSRNATPQAADSLSDSSSAQQPCAHHFIDPVMWMKPELEKGQLNGKFECPKCAAKVGGYAWQGTKCSCGEWVVPGISIGRSKVDEVKVRL